MPRFHRLVFFGTPEVAVPTLDALVASGRAPLLVVTQPDRPAGRGQRPRRAAVAERALGLGLDLAQPGRVREVAFHERLRGVAPDLAVVVAFGQIFPPELLAIPRRGSVNVHFSLLPRYRGAAPVQAAIAAGETITGVTTMMMDAGLDTGPTLLARSTPIGEEEEAGELGARLAVLGADVLVETVAGLEAGRLTPQLQDSAAASYAAKLGPETARADWTLPARRLHDRVRALAPRPGLDALLAGKPLKIWRTRPVANAVDQAPGTVLSAAARMLVACGDGSVLELLEVQRPGRRRLTAAEFARGERLPSGVSFDR